MEVYALLSAFLVVCFCHFYSECGLLGFLNLLWDFRLSSSEKKSIALEHQTIINCISINSTESLNEKSVGSNPTREGKNRGLLWNNVHHTLWSQSENEIWFNLLHAGRGSINTLAEEKEGYERQIDFRNKITIDLVSRGKIVYTSCSGLLCW